MYNSRVVFSILNCLTNMGNYKFYTYSDSSAVTKLIKLLLHYFAIFINFCFMKKHIKTDYFKYKLF